MIKTNINYHHQHTYLFYGFKFRLIASYWCSNLFDFDQSSSITSFSVNLDLGGCVVGDSHGRTSVAIAFLTAASAQAGSHKPDQVFVCCDILGRQGPLEEDPFKGLLLELSLEEYFQPSATAYFPHMQTQSGRLRMYTADQFARHLLDLGESEVFGDENSRAASVVIKLLTFQEDLYPKNLLVTGMEDVEFSTAEPADVVELESEREPGPGNNVVHPLNGSDGGEIDFTDLLMSYGNSEFSSGKSATCSDHPPRKKARTKPVPEVDSSGGGDALDEVKPPPESSLLDDPALAAFVDASDIADLQNAVKLCKEVDKSSDLNEWRLDRETSFSDAESDGDAEVCDEPAEAVEATASSSTASSSSKPSSRNQVLLVSGVWNGLIFDI